MREEYDYLTDATNDVLNGTVKAVAIGWNKVYQYVSDIARGDRKDPFAYFRSFYEGVLRGGVSTAAWDNDLAYLRQKHSQVSTSRDTSTAFQTKFRSGNAIFDRYMTAIADGKLTLDEVKQLEMLLDADDVIKKGVRDALRDHRLKLEQGGGLISSSVQ
jgi:hypothetical protein